jgi:hypothetical protein
MALEISRPSQLLNEHVSSFVACLSSAPDVTSNPRVVVARVEFLLAHVENAIEQLEDVIRLL